MARRASKVDATHAEIVQVFRCAGWPVLSLAAVGHGCPDLLVYGATALWLIEIKSGPKARTLRATAKKQAVFAQRFPVVRLDSAVSAADWIVSQ